MSFTLPKDATKFLGTASLKSTVRRARTRSIGYVQTVDVAPAKPPATMSW